MANIELRHSAAVAQSFCHASVEGIYCSSSVWEHPRGNQGRDCGHSFEQES